MVTKDGYSEGSLLETNGPYSPNNYLAWQPECVDGN